MKVESGKRRPIILVWMPKDKKKKQTNKKKKTKVCENARITASNE